GASSVASLALALLAGLVGVETQWRQAEAHLKDVLHQRSRAEAHLKDALHQRSRAEEHARKQVEARRRAQERFDAAMKALRRFEELTKDAALLREPHLEGLRAELLQTALGFY